MPKFKALVSFSHYNKMYDPHVEEPYEIEDADLFQAWAKAKYVEIIEEEKTKAKNADAIEEEKPKVKKGKKGA